MKTIESKYICQRKVVEVFKTNVKHEEDARLLIHRLEDEFPGTAINFVLDDCDKVLRVAYCDKLFDLNEIVAIVRNMGFEIEALP